MSLTVSEPMDPDAGPVDELPEPRLETAEVAGVGIKVELAWWTLTGTTHVADHLVITTSGGTLRFESSENDDAPTLPLLERIYPAGPSRWVILGWSSYGEGMQTEHAWLVDDKHAPRVVDTLEWTTDRSHAGLVIDAADTVQIGVPLPQRSTAEDHELALHNERDWSLAHGKRSFTLEQVAHLPAVEASVVTLKLYTPPAHDSASGRNWAGRFVWFSAEKKFVLHRP